MSLDKPCSHDTLIFTASLHAQAAGYTKFLPSQLAAATEPTGRVPTTVQPGVGGGKRRNTSAAVSCSSLLPKSTTFPAPLILPDDDLAVDPKQPAQSLRAWLRLKDRNAMTTARSVIYVAKPPAADPSMLVWERAYGINPKQRVHVDWDGVIDYLRAFFHGVEVRELQESMSFCAWEELTAPTTRKMSSSKPAKPEDYLGLHLRDAAQILRVRHRADPTQTFRRQLNLNDLLDAAVEILPTDAYALLMLMPWDLYEDAEDDYCCGRAYGGSRIGVVSSARYHPWLDESEGVDAIHQWPLSHCASYVEQILAVPREWRKSKSRTKATSVRTTEDAFPVDPSTPIGAAVIAASKAGVKSQDDTFLLRVNRTAAHELGHCFGLEHCLYFACVMQSTRSMAEDVRQPPYFCAVCIGKLGRAVREVSLATEIDSPTTPRGDAWEKTVAAKTAKAPKLEGTKDVKEVQQSVGNEWLKHWEVEWCDSMSKVCEGKRAYGWLGFKAWLERRMSELVSDE